MVLTGILRLNYKKVIFYFLPHFYHKHKKAGVAQLARASAFQADCREFESRLPLHFICNDPLAQLVEHLTFNEGANGSNPLRVTITILYRGIEQPGSSSGS